MPEGCEVERSSVAKFGIPIVCTYCSGIDSVASRQSWRMHCNDCTPLVHSTSTLG